jgi:hypothetical protein
LTRSRIPAEVVPGRSPIGPDEVTGTLNPPGRPSLPFQAHTYVTRWIDLLRSGLRVTRKARFAAAHVWGARPTLTQNIPVSVNSRSANRARSTRFLNALFDRG